VRLALVAASLMLVGASGAALYRVLRDPSPAPTPRAIAAPPARK